MESLSPARWERLDRLLDAALDLDPAEQTAYLHAYCPDDAALRDLAEHLLAVEVPRFLEQPAAEYAAPLLRAQQHAASTVPALHDLTGTRLGPYRLLQVLGHGGMGTVYLAERADDLFEQQVAIKLIRPEMLTEAVRARFELERQILAQLQHPHIARLLDGGMTEGGLPYLVMEYVDGQPITDYVAERNLPANERLDLFLQVTGAVQFAHRSLVVHRDLKPSNILVIPEGPSGEPEVKLLDFGIAKLLGDDHPYTQPITRTGQSWLTPEYAAPERLRGAAATTATDVYGLGSVLYEVLTGRPPFRRDPQTPYDLARAILEDAPPRPSQVVADGTADVRAARTLRGDLDAIVLKALRKAPEHRYGTAEALAADLQRYRDGWPVEARSDALGYRMRRLLVRYRRAVAVAAVVGLALLIGGGVALWQMQQAAFERQRAYEREVQYTTTRDIVNELWHHIDYHARTSPGLQAEIRRIKREGLKQYSPDSPLLAEFLAILASLQSETYDPDAAASLHTALRQVTTLVPEGSPTTASILSSLAHHYLIRGDVDSAIDFQERAIALCERFQEQGTPCAIDVYATLVSNETRRGQVNRAEALAEEALTVHDEASRALRGQMYRNIGYAHFHQGALSKADSFLQRSLVLTRSGFGPKHWQTLGVMSHLASVRRDQGRLDEAEALNRTVLDIHRAQDAPANLMGPAAYLLAFCLHRQGHFDEALPLAREAVALATRVHGARSTNTIGNVRLTGFILLDQGRLAEAEAALRDVAALYREHLPGATDDYSGVLNRLAWLLDERGNPEADAAYRKALAIHQARPPEDPIFVTWGLHFLADLMLRRGAHEQAARLLERLTPMYKTQLPDGHPYRQALTRLNAALTE